MQQQTSEQLHTWFRRVEPIYPELFNAAHAICGNYDLAEYALRSAVLETWIQDAGGGMGFRERLRGELRRAAFDVVRSEEAAGAEFTWPGFSGKGDDPVLALAAQEPVEIQRALMLRCGCGLSMRSVSQLTGESVGRLREDLERFESRCRRGLPRQERGRAEAMINRSLRRALTRNSAGIPSPAQIYRAFESEAEGMQPAGHRFSRGLGRVMVLLLALACAALFWLFAVIVQPPAEMPVSPAATEAAAPENPGL